MAWKDKWERQVISSVLEICQHSGDVVWETLSVSSVVIFLIYSVIY